jgi:AraC-like DNA-binding protein
MLKTEAVDARRFDHFRYHASADLEPYIEHFWVVRWDLRGLSPYRAETLPHPSIHMTFEPGKGARVGGIRRGKFSTVLKGVGGVFGTKFRPGGFYPFLQHPVAQLADKTVTLRSLWGFDGVALGKAVLDELGLDQRIMLVEDFLRRRRPQPDPNVTLATRIVAAIAADRKILRVDDVVTLSGLAPRRLQRLFARYVGVSPKWVIQRYRLHEAATQLERGPASQSGLALELGYADQAHFVKDFRTIVGTSPAAYARRAREMP